MPQTPTQVDWDIGPIDFHVVEGDIFELDVDALVNSEQTDFVLARNSWTISGQLRQQYAEQFESRFLRYDEDTQEYAPPRVELSHDIGDYEVIYHAGFHTSEDWLIDRSDDSVQAEYVDYIEECVRNILKKAHRSDIDSLALPVLGTGAFELNTELVIYQIGQTIDEYARQMPEGEELSVWLVVYEDNTDNILSTVLSGLGQAMIDRGLRDKTGTPFNLGIEFLDRFERRARRVSHDRWGTWEFIRYAEVSSNVMFAKLGRLDNSSFSPRDLVDGARPRSFGLVQHHMKEKAQAMGTAVDDSWGELFIQRLSIDAERENSLLNYLKRQRNHLAHGRLHEVDSSEAVRDAIRTFLNPEEWRACLEAEGPLRFGELEPWIAPADTDPQTPEVRRRPLDTEAGIFERDRGESFQYLDPLNRRRFEWAPKQVVRRSS